MIFNISKRNGNLMSATFFMTYDPKFKIKVYAYPNKLLGYKVITFFSLLTYPNNLLGSFVLLK